MRAYFFGNMYLSSIQQGIQAAHVTHELFTKLTHTISGEKTLQLYDWAQNHKTMVLLNGGYLETIQDLVEFFDRDENPYPWAAFHEGEDSLGGILTSVGIVLPEKIYLTSTAIRNQLMSYQSIAEDGTIAMTPELGYDVKEPTVVEISKWEHELIGRLGGFGLAR